MTLPKLLTAHFITFIEHFSQLNFRENEIFDYCFSI